MSKPVLFFSKKCTNCQSLWNRLTQENRLDDFVKICVDNNNKLPPMITEVPTIFIKDRPLITKMGINMYLNSPSTNNPTFKVSGSLNQPTKTAAAPNISTSTNGLNGIGDFNPIEMSSNWSDSYSFIQDNPSPLNFCYQFLDSNDAAAKGSAPNAGANGVKGSRHSDTHSKYEQMQKERQAYR